jgi:hypothetical protein
MKRLLLSLTKAQKVWIEARAKQLGASQTEVIRRLIDAGMEKNQK